jgi:hypothetical protein
MGTPTKEMALKRGLGCELRHDEVKENEASFGVLNPNTIKDPAPARSRVSFSITYNLNRDLLLRTVWLI